MDEVKNENFQSFDDQDSVSHQPWENEVKKQPQPKKTKKMNHWKIATAILTILLVVAVYTGFSDGNNVTGAISMNDAATKKKVKQFDWIDSTQIR